MLLYANVDTLSSCSLLNSGAGAVGVRVYVLMIALPSVENFFSIKHT